MSKRHLKPDKSKTKLLTSITCFFPRLRISVIVTLFNQWPKPKTLVSSLALTFFYSPYPISKTYWLFLQIIWHLITFHHLSCSLGSFWVLLMGCTSGSAVTGSEKGQCISSHLSLCFRTVSVPVAVSPRLWGPLLHGPSRHWALLCPCSFLLRNISPFLSGLALPSWLCKQRLNHSLFIWVTWGGGSFPSGRYLSI